MVSSWLFVRHDIQRAGSSGTDRRPSLHDSPVKEGSRESAMTTGASPDWDGLTRVLETHRSRGLRSAKRVHEVMVTAMQKSLHSRKFP